MPLHAVDEYPAAWYPVIAANALPPGRVVPVRAFGRDFAVFRGASGRVTLLARHCDHMGADLARGRVEGDALECPFHRVRIDAAGCGRFPPAGPALPDLCQPVLPVAEAHGLVFVRFGAPAAATIPGSDPAGAAQYRSAPCVRDFDTSYEVACLNNLDRSHFGPVHGRELLEYAAQAVGPGLLQVRFRARVAGTTPHDACMRGLGLREVEIHVDIHAANIALMRNPETGAAALVATLPLDAQRTRLFVVTQGVRRPGLAGALVDRLRFAVQSRLVMRFLRQDMAASEGMRVKLDAGLLARDSVLRLWSDYCAGLPRTSIERLVAECALPDRQPAGAERLSVVRNPG